MKKYKDFFKSILIVLVMQTITYYLIKILINDYNLINSVINFPFIKQFVYFYDSWYPFVFLASFIIYKHNKTLYYKMINTLVISTLLANITFIVYPTIIERPNIEINNLTDFVLYTTYKSDTPAVNCLPSIHCLFCFILIYYTYNLKTNYKFIIITYFILIILSTLFIHQHIIEDAILSLIYSVISIVIIKLYFNKKDFSKF